MAYLHCHTEGCEFSQDDFWSEDYNPITFMEKNSKDELLTYDLDAKVKFDQYWLDENGYSDGITRRELIAWEMERKAQRIRNMKYRTFEEYKEKNPEGICPKCGKKDLDID